jgi:[acyl-carrier-protein] S-malonyltransferase
MLDRLPAHEALPRLLDAAEALSGLKLRRLAAHGPAEALADTRAAQPLLFLADWACGSALLAEGLEPLAVAGHSLGEFAALAIADVFSVEAGLELVCERARLMSELAPEGSMAALIGLDRDAVADALATTPDVWVANDNGPGQVVISGTVEAIEAAVAALTAAGARRAIVLNVAGPFHSPLMREARDKFADLLSATAFNDARIPVLQNTDPTPETAADVLRARLADQMVSPVRWTETLEGLARLGADVVIEAGPGAVLTGIAKRMPSFTALASDDAGVDAVLEVIRR